MINMKEENREKNGTKLNYTGNMRECKQGIYIHINALGGE